MLALGIETSCDETAVALIERGQQNRLLGEQIKSQIDLHSRFGGVVPEIASRSHYESIDILTRSLLQETGIGWKDLDLLSVTQGPGLIGSLIIGLAYAKAASYAHKLPLVPVDHILAHIESAFIEHPDIAYPLLALVVSGGHTTLFLAQSKFDIQVLSKTRDDAVGEVMDKVAKFFDLGYPGGPVLDKIYGPGNPQGFAFKLPKMSDGSDDFSFSGYKTAVLKWAQQENLNRDHRRFADLIASFLNSVVDYLLKKVLAALEKYNLRQVIVAGGVSRNTLLRKRFQTELESRGVQLILPSLRFCTDNAAMVAWLGVEKYQQFPDQNYYDYQLNSYSRATFRDTQRHR